MPAGVGTAVVAPAQRLQRVCGGANCCAAGPQVRGGLHRRGAGMVTRSGVCPEQVPGRRPGGYFLVVRRTRTVVLVLAVLALAGCVRAPVDPRPGAVSTEASAPTIELPPRPRDVPLDGLDPCTLLTKEQQQELGLEDREPILTVSPTQLYGGVSSLCTARGYEPRAISLGIDAVTIKGIERYTVERVDATVTPIGARGFPAVQVVPPRPGYCTVIVDVAPGQLLDVQFADGGREPPIPTPDLCEGARLAAELAMDTLLRLR